ncbi:DNA mismatch repair protein MSH6-like [Rosa rugosa]|uniref:DNA mismatch repair protein MSH6-like n=1 Tax=Rosa rugosa TaxID=74645 RepID=UPI002B408DDA|nr:DNA mismatch repair protein MSH6-like [Rosa rugosa]
MPSPLQSKPNLNPKKLLYGQEVVGKRIKYDGDEETLDLATEKIELLQQTVQTFKRLQRGPLPTLEAPVAEEDEEDSNDDDDDDSGDEDWGKSVERKVVEPEEEDEVMELEDEHDDEEVPKFKGRNIRTHLAEIRPTSQPVNGFSQEPVRQPQWGKKSRATVKAKNQTNPPEASRKSTTPAC